MHCRILIKSLPCYFYQQNASYMKKVDTYMKRGSLLDLMMSNKYQKKKKKRHLASDDNILRSEGAFSEIKSTSRRQDALNKLFIQNISDVLSTGDVAPEIIGNGVEITGVKVAQDFKLANVYWQIPPSLFHNSDKIQSLLIRIAPQLRSELISRNLLGRVPHIYFIRDLVNENVALFEKALKEADLGPNSDGLISYEDIDLKNIYTFKSSKENKAKEEKNSVKEENINAGDEKSSTEVARVSPKVPQDMKLNVFGLDHEAFMFKIRSAKKTLKEPQAQSAVISAYDSDLFSKIPGSGFQGIDEDRDELLKQFCLNRKLLRNKALKSAGNSIPDVEPAEAELIEENYDEDFIEED